MPEANEVKNTLLMPWTGPFEAPPFHLVKPEDFRPAFDVAIAEQAAEITAIAESPEAPTFLNTIEALERSGDALDRVSAVFFNLTNTDTDDVLDAIDRDMAPLLARHRNSIYLNEKLFKRVQSLYTHRETLGLTPEQLRVLERYHVTFTRAGAGLSPEARARLSEISERLAALGTQFGQNVLADEKGFILVLDGPDDIAGLPEPLVAAAASAAVEHNLPGKYVITLSRSSVEPFLQFSSRRDLREKAFKAWAARGENGGATDNRAIAEETIRLRAERAKLMGFETYAEFQISDTMAKTPQAALDLLQSVWVPARLQALNEEAALQQMITEEGGNFEVAPWDWRYYSERLRKAKYDLNESELKPYLQLDKMIEAAFYTAGKLFGLSFTERTDIPLYNEDCHIWLVQRHGKDVALFIGDYYARSSKRSGAWMSGFRDQHKLRATGLPIIVNCLNFAKPAPGEPCLLSFDDAKTLFHEFGHGLHGMLSDVTYPKISGTNVARDFVEFPSQLYEHWLDQPEILRTYAMHYKTGEPMPEALLTRLLSTKLFNQGFATVEFTASALVDLDLHMSKEVETIDIAAFEKAELERLGMPKGIVMRHRTPHFQHIFAGDGYSAGYYSYMWSEILDADGFNAFEEAGDIFDPETAQKLHDYVYSAGYSRSPDEAYAAFRGRAPTSEALLRKRGLLESSPAGAG
jgi:peptidyl-dipeptidase Dcp